MSKLKMTITPRERDLGGFHVRRVLPFAQHRMVGPFIFFDHMGPARFSPGQGMDVRPHPHINLATVTYLFEGAIMHRDSLGSEQLILPGAINWMTAGRGIVHSERTPQSLREGGSQLEGLQCWVALPKESEEMEPSFVHHPADSLPEFHALEARIKLLVGELFGHRSPVKSEGDIVYADAQIPSGTTLEVPGTGRELAVYVLAGEVSVNGEAVAVGSMAIAQTGDDLKIQAQNSSRVMILGGAPVVGERHIFWNFVSSSNERIEKAKQDWRDQVFPKIPGDDTEFIPLPV